MEDDGVVVHCEKVRVESVCVGGNGGGGKVDRLRQMMGVVMVCCVDEDGDGGREGVSEWQ